MKKEKKLVVFAFICPVIVVAQTITYSFNDGSSHNQDFIFDGGYNVINIDKTTTLTTNITLNQGYSSIAVTNNSIINANIIANGISTTGTNRLTLDNTRQNNKFTINNEYADLSVTNPYMVALYSSDAEYEINNNARYTEISAGDANVLGAAHNPNIIKLKHNFYGDSKANIRWIDSTITGSIVLSDNAYAYYDAYVKTSFTGSMTVNDSAKLDFVLLAAMNSGNNASVINSDIHVNDNAVANFYFGDIYYANNVSQAMLNGNVIVKGNAVGNVITKGWGGFWNGDLITDDNAKGNYLISRDDNPFLNWQQWTGNALADHNSQISIELRGATVWTGKANQLNNALIDIKLEDTFERGTKWQLTGDSTVNSLSLHQGHVYLSSAANDLHQFNTLTTETLSGTGSFIFNTDIASNSGDKLIIKKPIEAGSQFAIEVNNQAGAYTKPYRDLLLVKTEKSGMDTFALVHNVEVGGYEYSLVKKGENWYLSTPNYLPSSTLKTAVSSAYATYLLDIVNKDVLIQRQGNLRTDTSTTGDVWVKNFTGRINHLENEVGLLDNLSMSYYGLQIGADKKIEDTQSFIGITAGYLGASQHYGANNKGSGRTNSFNFGAYFTSLHDNNTYINLLTKYSYYNNHLSAIDTAGDSVKGNTSTNVLATSAEMGYRYTLKNAYLEPFAQLTWAHFSSNTLKTNNELTIKMNSYDSLLSKVGLNIGISNFDSRNTSLYFKTAVIKENLANIYVKANDVKDHNNFKNHWFSSGLGITSELAKNHHVYSDVEVTYGGKFKNAQATIGYRFNF